MIGSRWASRVLAVVAVVLAAVLAVGLALKVTPMQTVRVAGQVITEICSGDHRSSSLSCTHARSTAFRASRAVFGRRARKSACACAASAR